MSEKEAINHPDHYRSGPYEVINIIEYYELGFNLGNVTKYILRAGVKDENKELEDLKKARWYLDREIGRMDGTVLGPDAYTTTGSGFDCPVYLKLEIEDYKKTIETLQEQINDLEAKNAAVSRILYSQVDVSRMNSTEFNLCSEINLPSDKTKFITERDTGDETAR